MRAERDGTRLLPIGFASCFLSGLQAADRDCELVDQEHELAVMRTEAEQGCGVPPKEALDGARLLEITSTVISLLK
ncbi:hypothetical protein DY000_02038424 [Brassica cretica]|uniref:Uncharacterized protein n=1 Tax=Brassica cretica TaxID=69181 RepID=A0ABQ7B9S7_BRACR|nr:hypothetical protein DY000_02038424 [Brassica cretica]